MTHKAYRYRNTVTGQFLQNSIFASANCAFIGAFHGCETDAIYDPVLAAEEERVGCESHRQDFAIAFGIPATDIECVVVMGWNGDPKSLPLADDENPRGKHVRLPEAQRAGYVAPPPKVRTPLEAAFAALAADSALSPATKAAFAALKG